MTMILSVNGRAEQIALVVSQFRDIGAVVYSEPGRIVVRCDTPEVERAVRKAIAIDAHAGA